ncbi:MAG: hypothetical protein ACREQ5_14805 [Candidatus Dormibacteria bacterium]
MKQYGLTYRDFADQATPSSRRSGQGRVIRAWRYDVRRELRAVGYHPNSDDDAVRIAKFVEHAVARATSRDRMVLIVRMLYHCKKRQAWCRAHRGTLDEWGQQYGELLSARNPIVMPSAFDVRPKPQIPASFIHPGSYGAFAYAIAKQLVADKALTNRASSIAAKSIDAWLRETEKPRLKALVDWFGDSPMFINVRVREMPFLAGVRVPERPALVGGRVPERPAKEREPTHVEYVEAVMRHALQRPRAARE